MGTGIPRALWVIPGVTGGKIARHTAHVTSGPTWSRAARPADRAVTRVIRHLGRSDQKRNTRAGGGYTVSKMSTVIFQKNLWNAQILYHRTL